MISRTRCCATVHPHGRGDGGRVEIYARPLLGSPPRAWGRLRTLIALTSITRFTPTCVGTAARRNHLRSVLAVHPHVRGDGEEDKHAIRARAGSPPRAWGRLRRQ